MFLYCHKCKQILSEKQLKEGQYSFIEESEGHSIWEVICFRCLLRPYCKAENCTTIVGNNSQRCRKCKGLTGFCCLHNEFRMHVNTDHKDTPPPCFTDISDKNSESLLPKSELSIVSVTFCCNFLRSSRYLILLVRLVSGNFFCAK